MTKRTSSKRVITFSTLCLPLSRRFAPAAPSRSTAEAYTWNSVPAGTGVLLWAADFSDLLNKESFDSLPEKWAWDHAIELVLDVKPANCIYFLDSGVVEKIRKPQGYKVEVIAE
jgi:hypothetical protein